MWISLQVVDFGGARRDRTADLYNAILVGKLRSNNHLAEASPARFSPSPVKGRVPNFSHSQWANNSLWGDVAIGCAA